MSEIGIAKINQDGWIKCPHCGRKFGRAVGDWTQAGAETRIEVKCHSCKRIVDIWCGRKEQA